MNTVIAIRNSRDKLATKSLLQLKEVRTPREVSIETLVGTEDFTPIVVKDRFGYGAKGMEVHTAPPTGHTKDILLKKLRNPRYFLESIVVCEREYRVFVVNGDIIHVCAKIPDPGTEDQVIRNASNSKFIACRDNKVRSRDVKDQALAAAEACGLYRAAVDVGLDAEGKAWIWETNTRPAISRDYVRDAWNGVRAGE